MSDPYVSGSRETILVVEDERPVRELVGDVLRLHGYQVLTAEDGPSALQALGAHSGPIDMVIVDVVIPGMQVKELVDRLTATRPALKLLYISGFTGDLVGQHGLVRLETNFLQKPFTVDGLARKVRDVLDTR
jgi:two-component system, cell cycle sensor histidine kinase and response regulator CckA